MNIIIWCLLFATYSLRQVQATIAYSVPITSSCFREDSAKCVIVSLDQSNPSQDVRLPSLSGKSTLQINRGHLYTFSAELARQLGTVEKLQLGPLNLTEIFVNEHLQELTARGNQINSVQFSTASLQFKLRTLDLRGNRLKQLSGFEVLTNLRELHLQDNALESVDMEVFKSMAILEKLFLDRNRIAALTAVQPINLPVLEYFSLSGNLLKKIDVTNWQLDSLTKWDVSNNSLVNIAGGLEERFPSLQMISVGKNQWHCRWLEETLQRFNESSVMVQDRDEDCQGISPANICCVPEDNEDSVTDDQLSKLNALEMNQQNIRAELERQFGRIKSLGDSNLKSLESQLKKLEELEKYKKENPTAGDTNPMMSRLKLFERDFLDAESSLKQQQQLWEKQRKSNESAQRKLGYTILELKLSLERDKKQVAELQGQVKNLQDFIRNKLEIRDKLMI